MPRPFTSRPLAVLPGGWERTEADRARRSALPVTDLLLNGPDPEQPWGAPWVPPPNTLYAECVSLCPSELKGFWSGTPSPFGGNRAAATGSFKDLEHQSHL